MANFKKFRLDNKLSQKETANYFKCGQSFISQIESGRRPIPEYFISKVLADSLLKPEWLITDESHIVSSRTINENPPVTYSRIEELTKSDEMELIREMMGIIKTQSAQLSHVIATNERAVIANERAITANEKAIDEIARSGRRTDEVIAILKGDGISPKKEAV